MRRFCFLAVSLVLLASAGQAQEKLTLASPVSQASITEWAVAKFEVDVENSAIRVVVKSNTGAYLSVTYEQAATLINGLNTANLSTKSLRCRILERLESDGHIGDGTTSGCT